MKNAYACLGAAFLTGLVASSAGAATVTANFVGFVDDKNDFPNVNEDSDPVSFTIIGRDDAPEIFVSDPGIAPSTFSSVSAYQLQSLSFSAPGLSYTSTDATLFVYDNGSFGSDTFDIITAYGTFEGDTPGSVGGELLYFASFDPNTYSDTSLSTAVAQGLANTSTFIQEAAVVFDPSEISVDGCTKPNCFVRGAIGLNPPLLIVQDPVDPMDPTDPTDPGIAPVPLPASGWALIVALGGLIGLRRRARA